MANGRGTTLRGLGFVNHANMGSYREAIDAFESGRDPAPNIEAHRQQGRVKYGTGLNVEQTLPKRVRAFARAGWNEGDSESFAYTEVNNTVSAGFDVWGGGWRRDHDKIGVAFVSNGLSDAHREYLRLGGLGFLLGDGTLTAAKRSSRRTTPHASGAACRPQEDCSILSIPATSAPGDR